MTEMGVPIQDFLANRRNRCIGSILGNAERDFFKQLTPEQRDSFRQLVRDAVGSYHDSVLDLVRAEDSVRNEEVLAALTRIERKVAARPALPKGGPLQTGV
ncbi:MAG: hypothetical protein HOV97_05060 [Nonomuraea sp.]|nr:hypothetical protein [Nonomuraea sp.]